MRVQFWCSLFSLVKIARQVSAYYLTIDPWVSVRSSRYEARGKFGERVRCSLNFPSALYLDERTADT